MNNPVFHESTSNIGKACDVLATFSNTFGVYKCEDTVKWSDLITYCAICQNWKGSKLHCTVYNLRYSKYLDELKQSWTATPNTESLDYMKIWSESAKVLIISNVDYVNFGDFECQTLLNLIQQRNTEGLSTILITPTTGVITKSNSSMFSIMLKKQIDEHLYKNKTGGQSS